jgi:hypothetical protein
MVAHQSVGGNPFGRIAMHKIFCCKIAKTLYTFSLLLPMKSDPTVKLRNFNIVDQMQFN